METVVRLLSCMNTLVAPESSLLTEVLTTLITVVRLLSCMNTLVSPEITLITECLPTLLTAEQSWFVHVCLG